MSTSFKDLVRMGNEAIEYLKQKEEKKKQIEKIMQASKYLKVQVAR